MREVCTGCGTRAAEWAEDPTVYVGWSQRCMGCEVLEQERENLEGDVKGVRVMLRRNSADLDHGGG